jgi:diguanylate cyclase (GGDEF)-like protein
MSANSRDRGTSPRGSLPVPFASSDQSRVVLDELEVVDDADTENTAEPAAKTGAFARPARMVTSPKQMCTVVRVTSGEDMLRVVRLENGVPVQVGRDAGAGLTLSDPSVSRRHAVLEIGPEGCIVRDLGSTNGTFVNGERVYQNTLVTLGDRLEVGSVILRLERISESEIAHLERVIAHLDTARQDPLTGLLTRRWMQDDLPVLAERAAERKQKVTAIFFDIDHFKSVNDTFGHPVGDQVIKTVARLIAWSIRASDFGMRYGGEEFLLILTDCDEAGAVATAERIRKRVGSHPWAEEGLGSRLITLSAGVGVREEGEPIAAWIERTDHALLRAKRSGRNRTLTAGGGSLRADGKTVPD